MKYNMKYFDEHAKRDDNTYFCDVYYLDDHTIAVTPCDRCARRQYYSVCVDGTTVATRSLLSNAVRTALEYLNRIKE